MVRVRFTSVPLVLALAVGLSGCAFMPRIGGGGATPTPTAASTEEAAAAFTGTICTFNDAAFAFDTTWSDLEAPLREVQEAASLSRIEAETAKTELQSVAWPSDIADDVVVIEEYLDGRIAKLDQVIQAETVEELDEIDFTTPDEVNTAATEIETSLSLGTEYCPETPAAEQEPTDAGLGGTTWSGTDSDGDETEIVLAADGTATATVGATVYDGTWELADDVVTIDVSTADNALTFTGYYTAGVNTMNLSGTATNGHTWTVLVTSF